MEIIQHETKNWFKTWFDSPYYELLYQNRNEKEAQLFIDKLINHLSPKKNSYFLDLCCGKGRHAKYINNLGYKIDGTDLSKRNISALQKFNNKKIHFFQSDMRKINVIDKYDYVLNLFTSFGYFEKQEDDLLVANQIYKSLKYQGILIIDFINMNKALIEIKKYDNIKIGNINFEIEKKYDNQFLYKKINFTDKKKKYSFTEKVKILNKYDFKHIFEKNKLKLIETFGDYKLNKFHNNSDRLIMVFKKLIN